jgi:hypothetical protein
MFNFLNRLFSRNSRQKPRVEQSSKTSPALTPPKTAIIPTKTTHQAQQASQNGHFLITQLSFSAEELEQNANTYGEMYFNCPGCGHCERVNDIGKAILKTNPFAWKTYKCLKCGHTFDAAPRIKFGEHSATGSLTPAPVSTSAAADVQFKRKWEKQNNLGLTDTYEEWTAPSSSAAKAYLNTRTITQRQYYVVVETPEGNWGKDVAGIYQE